MKTLFSSLSFYNATAADIPLLAELTYKAWENKLIKTRHLILDKDFEKDMRKEKTLRMQEDFQTNEFIALIAHDRGDKNAARGFVSFFETDKTGMAYIQDLYAVSGKLTGTGVLEEAKKLLRQQNADRIQLEANYTALDFYKRNGFRKISVDPNVFLMECTL